jgi:hypothetical protein
MICFTARRFFSALTVGLALTTTCSVSAKKADTVAGAGVDSISYSGPGCPDGSVTVAMLPDGSLFSLSFSKFFAQAGPGVPSDAARTQCKLHVKMRVPKGFDYSITGVDYTGYASLDPGVRAGRASTYHFSGEAPDPVVTTKLVGPMADGFFLTDGAAGELDAPCAKGKNLHITTEAMVDNAANPSGSGLLAFDGVDGEIETYRLQWHRCP